MASYASFFSFPLFVTRCGGTKADIGILMGAFSLASVLCRPWVSTMIDAFGRKKSFTLGSILMTIIPLTYLSLSSDQTISQLYLKILAIRIIHGIGFAICFTAAFTFAVDIIPENRLNEGIGIFGISGLTGLGAGPFIAETVIDTLGFPAFFITSSALASLALIFNGLLEESYPGIPLTSQVSFFKVVARKKNIIVAVLAFLFGVALAASGNFIFPYAAEYNLAGGFLYYAFYSGSAIASRLRGGTMADRLGESRIIPYAITLTAVGFLSLLPQPTCKTLIISGLLTGCGHGLLYPCLNSLAVRNESIQDRGKITGIFTGSIDAGNLIGSLSLGYIGDLTGFTGLFTSTILSLLFGLVIFKVSLRIRIISPLK